MVDEKVLTQQIAEQFLKDNYSVDLDEFETIEDQAANVLGRFHKGMLSLDGLTALGPESASHLGQIPGDLYLRSLPNLSEAAAKGLAENTHHLVLSSIAQLDDATVCELAQHKGHWLELGLEIVSVAAARAFASYGGEWLSLAQVQRLDAEAAKYLSAFEGTLYIPGLRELDPETAMALGEKRYGESILRDKAQKCWDSTTKEIIRTDPPPLSFSPEAAVAIGASPCFSLSHHRYDPEDLGKCISKSFRKTTLSKTLMKEVKVRLASIAKKPFEPSLLLDSIAATERADAFRAIIADLDAQNASTADLDKLFPAPTIKKLVNVMNPHIWESLAACLSGDPNLYSRLFRTARDLVQSRTKSDGRFESCIDLLLSSDSGTASELLAFLLDQGFEYQLRGPFSDCFGRLSFGWYGISEPMALALTHYRGPLHLHLYALEPSICRHLAKYTGYQMTIDVDAITEEAAQELGCFRGEWLSLEVKELGASTAKALSRVNCCMELNNLQDLSDDAAMFLSKFVGEVLNLDSVERFGEGPGHLALARRLAAQSQIKCSELRHISPEIAAIFAQSQARLFLSREVEQMVEEARQ